MLSPHPDTALEYWFFKVNAGEAPAGPVALLVDWIARRQSQANLLRVSVHSPQGRAVVLEDRSPLFGEDHYLNPERTVGKAGSVEWALDIDLNPVAWIAPDIFPVGLLRLTDLTLVSAPQARFTGWIRHLGQRFEVRRAPGVLSHYWGRQLAPEWWWVSANQFDRADMAVECSVLRTGVWGIPLGLPLAYLYLQQGGRRELIISPPALAKATGTPEAFEIQFKRLGRPPLILKAHGGDYGDLGDGIVNTLVGDLEIWEGSALLARAAGTAGLERRAPQTYPEGQPG